MKICLPIRESSQEKILKIFEENKNDYDLFEIWLDAVRDLDIKELITASPKPVLCVCKAKEEKGSFTGSEEDRIQLLIQSAQAGAAFIDIGIHTDIKLIQMAKERKGQSKLILSCHNWDKTPKLTSILSRIDEMIVFKPDYVKYVATASSLEDNIHIFRLAENLKKKGQKFIVMCMGKHGKMSRVITPLFGSEWMYAPKEVEQASAPGQIAVADLKKVWEILR